MLIWVYQGLPALTELLVELSIGIQDFYGYFLGILSFDTILNATVIIHQSDPPQASGLSSCPRR